MYTPIIYIEPLRDRNLNALGYYISSNPLMRKAIEEARDSNHVILTDKVTLIQEGTTETQPGIVIYSPIYRKDMPVNTIEERRVAINGWSAISFSVNDFMVGIIGISDDIGHNQVELQLYDSGGISTESLLYSSENFPDQKSAESTSKNILLPIEFNGKNWTLQFAQVKSTSFMSIKIVVLISGIMISLLLSFLVFSLINTASFAKRIAKKLTLDLTERNKELVTTNDLLKESYSELEIAKGKAEESEDKLKLIANNVVNGMIYQVVMLDENRRKFTYVSEAVYQLYGCTANEAKENPDLIYGKIHKDDIDDLIEKEKEALKEMSIFKTEVRVINPDGSIRWSYFVSRPRIIKGLVCWDGIEVDITEQKKVEK